MEFVPLENHNEALLEFEKVDALSKSLRSPVVPETHKRVSPQTKPTNRGTLSAMGPDERPWTRWYGARLRRPSDLPVARGRDWHRLDLGQN